MRPGGASTSGRRPSGSCGRRSTRGRGPRAGRRRRAAGRSTHMAILMRRCSAGDRVPSKARFLRASHERPRGARNRERTPVGRPYTQKMDAHALAVLEFPAIVERLAGATETRAGRRAGAAARRRRPTADEVARRQALTAEGLALLDAAAEPSLAGLADVREAAAHAARERHARRRATCGRSRLRSRSRSRRGARSTRRRDAGAAPRASSLTPLDPSLARARRGDRPRGRGGRHRPARRRLAGAPPPARRAAQRAAARDRGAAAASRGRAS